MEIKLQLPDGRISLVTIGESLKNLSSYIHNKKVFILTDATIYQLYHQQFPANYHVITMPAGEPNKTLNTVLEVIRQLIEHGADRSSFIVGIGGGIVCDVTGFIASIYMRGTKFGFVPTTLLAQVDASVGGKNGVNCDGYKNMIGIFNQPDFVMCDPSVLKTLPPRELKSGLAEVVKAGLITNISLFEYIENNVQPILACDPEKLNYIVENSIRIKANIVEADERETGERKKLNLGHTVGHAVEKHSHNQLLHGEAVSIGMVIAARISEKLGLLSNNDVERITALLKNIGLPVTTDIPAQNLIEAVGKDKKKHGDSVHFVLNNGLGEVIIKEIPYDELSTLLEVV